MSDGPSGQATDDPGPDPRYRPCVGVALFNRSGQVFLGQRLGHAGDEGWQMPQGGIDRGETPLEAAIRELREETGVRHAELLGETSEWLTYDLPEVAMKASWRGRYRGQAQKWFAFRLLGPDSEIDIAPVDHPAEFGSWRWAALSEAPRLIVTFKRAVYEKVAEQFAGFSNLK